MIKVHLTGEQVRATRAALGESQDDFAVRVGSSRPQIHRYEKAGLPERMNAGVRDNLVRLARETGALE